MNKRFIAIGLGTVAGVVLMRRGAAHCSGMDCGKMIERMPDDAPPKWMFRNIGAIRANTDRILELLEADRKAGSTSAEPAPSLLGPVPSR